MTLYNGKSKQATSEGASQNMSRRNNPQNQSQEDPMSDDSVDDTPITSDTDGTEAAMDPSTASSEGAEQTEKRKRDAHVEGFGTPVDLANLLNKPVEEGGRAANVRPQQIYGYLRNDNAGFREAVSASVHTDGRNIVNLEAGLAWWDAKEARKAARAEKAAAKASAAEETTPAEPVDA